MKTNYRKLMKRTRPVVGFRIDNENLRKLERVAQSEYRTLANVVEIAVIKFLEEREQQSA